MKKPACNIPQIPTADTKFDGDETVHEAVAPKSKPAKHKPTPAPAPTPAEPAAN